MSGLTTTALLGTGSGDRFDVHRGGSGPFEEGARPLRKTGELQEKRFNKMVRRGVDGSSPVRVPRTICSNFCATGERVLHPPQCAEDRMAMRAPDGACITCRHTSGTVGA